MDKFGLLPSGNSVPFEVHIEHLDPQRRELLLQLRGFVKSLGPNVIEQVRPHRVVYAKTLTFRTFLDIEPAGDKLIIGIRTEHGEPHIRMEVRTQLDLKQAEKEVKGRYEKIR